MTWNYLGTTWLLTSLQDSSMILRKSYSMSMDFTYDDKMIVMILLGCIIVVCVCQIYLSL